MADSQRPLLSATDEGHSEYLKKDIPSFGDLKNMYYDGKNYMKRTPETLLTY